MDVLTPEQRRLNMQHIRSKDTSIEIKLRKALWHKGFRYRTNNKSLPGKPDIVLRRYMTVVFVNGCFWHMHDCPGFAMPKSRTEYWKTKLENNVRRDQLHYKELEKQGWNVIVVWECQLKKQNLDETIDRIAKAISQNGCEI